MRSFVIAASGILAAEFGCEEATWLGARNARRALAIALTGMEQDGEISPARSAELAHMVLHRNAETLYNLPHP
jgi:hypothetical protein